MCKYNLDVDIHDESKQDVESNPQQFGDTAICSEENDSVVDMQGVEWLFII